MQETDKVEPFFDVEKAIMGWGVAMCSKNARSRKQKRMRKRQFVNNELVMDVQIDWSHLSVSNMTVWGRITDKHLSTSENYKNGAPGNITTSPSSNTATLSQGSDNMASSPGNAVTSSAKTTDVIDTDVNALFETEFNNDTSVNQEYTMKIEKTTRSSLSTQIENGVTKGIELTASLSVYDILEVGTGFSREVSLTKMEGETLEKEVTWGAVSKVVVPAGKKASATMHVIEKQRSGEFAILTSMSGYVTIKYISLKDDSLVFGHSGQIVSIVRHFVKEMKSEGKKFVGIRFPDDSKVEFQTRGNCAFRYGIKQVVTVVQNPAE